MTPIERIQKAAAELEAALADTDITRFDFHVEHQTVCKPDDRGLMTRKVCGQTRARISIWVGSERIYP